MLILKRKYQPIASLLLNSFRRSISLLAEEGSVVDGKDEIIFFKSFQEEKAKYQSLLKTHDHTNLIFLLSLNEKISCGPLVKKIQGQKLESLLHNKLEILTDDKEFSFNFSEQVFGSIIDYQGNVLEPKENTQNNENNVGVQPFSNTYKVQEIFKKQGDIQKRVGTDGQLWTGCNLTKKIVCDKLLNREFGH